MSDAELYERAVAAAERAYAPYSNYHVGAAALARDGTVLEGVNVENAAYPLGVCAERTLLAGAVVAGYRPGEIEAVAITASPCGGCRQWLYEFKVDRVVFPSGGDLVTRTHGGAPAGRVGRPVKSGFIAVAGRPNVGKSTLVNALCGGKVAITSRVPHTTRRRIFGIANGDDYQLVLVDLPGLPAAVRPAHRADAEDGGLGVRGHRRRAVRPLRARADRRGRQLHRQARVRARRSGDHRAQQGRPAQGEPHRLADADRGEARATSTRSIPSARRRATGSTSSAPTSSSCCPRGRRTSRATRTRI